MSEEQRQWNYEARKNIIYEIKQRDKILLIDNVYKKAINDVLKLIEEDKVLLKIHKFHLKNKIKGIKQTN